MKNGGIRTKIKNQMRKLIYNNIVWEYSVGKKFVLVRTKTLRKRILIEKHRCPHSAYYACECCGFQFWKGSIEETQLLSDGWDHGLYLKIAIKPHHIKQLIEYHTKKI